MNPFEKIAAVDLRVLRGVQDGVSLPGAVAVATGLSHVGEHAAAWIGIGAAGFVLDRRRRREWAVATTAVVAAHGASVVLKRVARRHRPLDHHVRVRVATPSRWSMPSSHATSTTAAAVAFAPLLPAPVRPLLVALPGAMALSRLVLGVHYPTDVTAGALLGAATTAAVRRTADRIS